MNKFKPVKIDKKEVLFWTILLPSLFFILIGMYLGLGEISKGNSKICTFMGKLWIPEAQVTSSKPEGCYTYGQLAEIEFEESN